MRLRMEVEEGWVLRAVHGVLGWQALVAWQLGDWLGVPSSYEAREELFRACKKAGLEESFHSAVTAVRLRAKEVETVFPAATLPTALASHDNL